MRQMTRTGADTLRHVAQRDGFGMTSIEYPNLFMMETTESPMTVIREHRPTRVLVNIRGKHHASYWNKGKREEFGIPAMDFATYTDMAKHLEVPLYFIFYEERSKTLSCISSNEVLLFARVWEKDNVDTGGTLFVPKSKVMPLAHLREDGQTQFINHFVPKKEIVQGVIS